MSTIRTVFVVLAGVALAGLGATLFGGSAQAACPSRGCIVRPSALPVYVHPVVGWYSRRPWIHTISSGTHQATTRQSFTRQETVKTMKVSPHGPAGPSVGDGSGGAQFSPYGRSQASGGAQSSSPPVLSGANAGPDGGRTQAGGGTQADVSASRSRSTSGSSAGSNAGATRPSTTPGLSAVTVCMTPMGACEMQRAVGTPCQCKDTQGRVYDGVVQ